MPPFKDENILIIAPGSQTTLAQLGIPESYTPASNKFPTRVFQAPDGKTFEAYRIRGRRKEKEEDKSGGEINGAEKEAGVKDVEMGGTAQEGGEKAPAVEEIEELIEDQDDDEGAIYPLKGTC